MAAERLTPHDQLTGLPYPLVPVADIRPRLGEADFHHHFHPRKQLDPTVPGELALRNVRLQLADYHVHHSLYHSVYYGPPLPRSEDEQFRTIIFASALYIPDKALDFTGRKPREVALTPDMRLHLQTSGNLRFGNAGSVRGFIQSYVMKQPIRALNINETTLEEFMETKDLERRRNLGHTLLALSVDRATEPLGSPYQQARRSQLILPGLPPSIQRFTKTRLGTLKMREHLVDELHTKLLSSA